MSLKDYEVKRDNFLLDKRGAIYSGFAFPCCCCGHNLRNVTEEPCSSCDHNANAVNGDPPNETVERAAHKTEEMR